jgi:hypothetical protein
MSFDPKRGGSRVMTDRDLGAEEQIREVLQRYYPGAAPGEPSTAVPYTPEDLARGERIVRELHGLSGYEAWAEHIAKALAAARGAGGEKAPRTFPCARCTDPMDCGSWDCCMATGADWRSGS